MGLTTDKKRIYMCKGTENGASPKVLIDIAPQFAGEEIVLFPLLLIVSN